MPRRRGLRTGAGQEWLRTCHAREHLPPRRLGGRRRPLLPSQPAQRGARGRSSSWASVALGMQRCACRSEYLHVGKPGRGERVQFLQSRRLWVEAPSGSLKPDVGRPASPSHEAAPRPTWAEPGLQAGRAQGRGFCVCPSTAEHRGVECGGPGQQVGLQLPRGRRDSGRAPTLGALIFSARRGGGQTFPKSRGGGGGRTQVSSQPTAGTRCKCSLFFQTGPLPSSLNSDGKHSGTGHSFRNAPPRSWRSPRAFRTDTSLRGWETGVAASERREIGPGVSGHGAAGLPRTAGAAGLRPASCALRPGRACVWAPPLRSPRGRGARRSSARPCPRPAARRRAAAPARLARGGMEAAPQLPYLFPWQSRSGNGSN